MERLNIAVVGLGRLGSMRVQDIVEKIDNANLVALCDVDEQKLENLGKLYQVENRFTDYEQMMKQCALDAVIISNSSDEHVKVIETALTAGKHIFCEKPIATNPSDLIEIEKKIKDSTIFHVGFTKRMDPEYLKIKEMISNKTIGDLVFLKLFASEAVDDIEFYKKFLPRSGGMIFDIASHDIDLARWFTKSEPVSISALGGVFGHKEIGEYGDIDNYLVTMEMGNGVMVELIGQRNPKSEFIRTVELIGTDGSIEHRVDMRGTITVNGNSPKGNSEMTAFADKYRKLYTLELQNFVNSVFDNSFSSAGFEDGKAAAIIASDIYISLREGRIITSEKRNLAHEKL